MVVSEQFIDLFPWTERTLWECGPKPKCLTASRELREPRRRTVLEPVGARVATSSMVKTSPPDFSIRARAEAVKRMAAMESLGSSNFVSTSLNSWGA